MQQQTETTFEENKNRWHFVQWHFVRDSAAARLSLVKAALFISDFIIIIIIIINVRRTTETATPEPNR